MILANPCSCCCKYLQHQKSAQHLPETCPGDCVNNLPEADLYRQAQWKLIWADLWAAVAGRFRADVGQIVRLANRRPNVCKSATQCLQICDLQLLRADVGQMLGRFFGLQIGDPMFANRRPILANKHCFQMIESVDLSTTDPVDWLAGWLPGWLAGWRADCLTG